MTSHERSTVRNLTPEDPAYRQLRQDLARAARRWIRRDRVSAAELARRLGSSATQVEQLVSERNAVSLDLVVRSLLAVGATRRDIALEIVRDS